VTKRDAAIEGSLPSIDSQPETRDTGELWKKFIPGMRRQSNGRFVLDCYDQFGPVRLTSRPEDSVGRLQKRVGGQIRSYLCDSFRQENPNGSTSGGFAGFDV